MSRCELRPAAEEDLESIADYTAEDNLSRAVTVVQELREKCQLLAEMPKSVPARPERGEDIRSRPAGNYVIYYRPVSGGVEIIRILHGRREVDPDIFDDGRALSNSPAPLPLSRSLTPHSAHETDTTRGGGTGRLPASTPRACRAARCGRRRAQRGGRRSARWRTGGQ